MGVFVQTITGTEVLAALTSDTTKWKGAVIDTLPNMISELRFYSVPDNINVAAAKATLALPSVVIPTLTGLTIDYAYIGIRYGSFFNDNGAANRVDEAGAIQVKESVSGTYTTGLNIAANEFTAEPNARLPTMSEIVGHVDLVSEIASPALTYNFRWLDSGAAGDTLRFYDFQTFIILGVKLT